MDGTLGEDITNPEELRRCVHAELVSLRGQPGRLTIQKFGQFESLRRVCGGGDLLDAYLVFEREMKRYATAAGRNEAAAAISITAPAENLLDRLEHAVGALPQDGKLRDQRTGRRWSDAGMITIADDLVYMAEVQGRLGQELLSIEISGDEQRGLCLSVDQMTIVGLPTRAPLVRVWHYRDDEPEEHALAVDLDEFDEAVAKSETYRMTRHRVAVELPSRHDSDQQAGRILSVSIEGRDAPMRTVSIQDQSTFSDQYTVDTMLYRTIVTVTLAVA